MKHDGHTVMAGVTQWTYCSVVEIEPGVWSPDWHKEIVESVEVDESTIWCETCNQQVEVTQ